MSDPWMKFYPSDWRSDPALRMCSLAARGLWIEMIALMHEAEPYGHLLVSGIAPTDAQLTVLTGTPLDQLPGLLGELELTGVFSRTPKGVIYSRLLIEWRNRSQFRPAIPAYLRSLVMDRDGRRCRYCGSFDGPFHLDHVYPWSRGGSHDEKNLVVACAPCNLSKSDRSPEEMGWVFNV